MYRFKNGFTLIEVLISMLLLSLIMIYVVGAINDSSKTNEQVLAEDREFLQVEASLERINLDFSQIYSPLYYSFLNKEEKFITSENFPLISKDKIPIPEILQPEKSTLIFYTAVNRRKLENSKQSHYAWVRYSLRESSIQDDELKREGADYELVRQFISSDPYAKEHNWDDVKEQLLIRHVKDMEFSFWSKAKEKFVSNLQEIGTGQRIIRGLKVSLTWIDINNNEWVNERYYRPLWPYFSAENERRQYQQELARKAREEKLKNNPPRPLIPNPRNKNEQTSN